MKSLTKGYVAIGGGGLALVGSGCLYTWPETIQEAQKAFINKEDVDSCQLMDDSAYRFVVFYYFVQLN